MGERMTSEEKFQAARRLIDENDGPSRALELLREAADEGHAGAKYALGTWHLHGWMLPKDEAKGLALILEAADLSYPEALYDAAVAYEEGLLIEMDLFKAFSMYLKAALLGERQSIYEAGRMLYYGEGVERCEKVARVFLDTAEELNIN